MSKKVKKVNVESLLTSEETVAILKKLRKGTKCPVRKKRLASCLKDIKTAGFENSHLRRLILAFINANKAEYVFSKEDTSLFTALLYSRFINNGPHLKEVNILQTQGLYYTPSDIGRYKSIK